MAKAVYPKRAMFPKNLQSRFLLGQKNKLKISWKNLANKIGVHKRTLNDWKREQYFISFDAVKKICEISNSTIPTNIKIKEPFWYVFKGAKIGGKMGAIACFKKYGSYGGNPEYRKKKWYEWWHRKGQYQRNGCIKGPLPIKIPRFSTDLAEFTGIIIGDGGISDRQVMVCTNSIDDKKYAYFVKKLIKKIFNINASLYYRKKEQAVYIAVSRKKLVEFCNKKLGLKVGNKLKQGLDVPRWIRSNLGFEKACIRGIMDTDGCVFRECHNIKGKKYIYKRISIVSVSPMLRKSIFEIFEKLNLSPKIRNNRCVQIENAEKIKKYFRLIGSHNPKHLKRYYK